MKECFETLKKNIPNIDEKKTSNLSVLRSALRYIQVRRAHRPFSSVNAEHSRDVDEFRLPVSDAVDRHGSDVASSVADSSEAALAAKRPNR